MDLILFTYHGPISMKGLVIPATERKSATQNSRAAPHFPGGSCSSQVCMIPIQFSSPVHNAFFHFYFLIPNFAMPLDWIGYGQLHHIHISLFHLVFRVAILFRFEYLDSFKFSLLLDT